MCVLDIGRDVGALVVHADAALLGSVIEIRPVDGGGRTPRVHAEVRRRGESALAAVICAVEGEYELWIDGSGPERRIRIRGGAVTSERVGPATTR
ncbi:MAG TPA: hypothetical protein VFC42_01065 [Methylomirabilota bacterium]|nr:hypothetical protein [Methylomirabilota bacterium]